MIQNGIKTLLAYFSNPHRQWVMIAFSLFLIVSLFWVPFGLHTTATVEGWHMLFDASQEGWSSRNGDRFMVVLPWEIATQLTPDSFVGSQLILAILFWGKAFLLYLILRKLNVLNHATVFFVAILFIIYPADTGQFTLRALGRHSGVFFYLLSVLFMILTCKREKKIYFFLMIVAHTIACFTAESGALMQLLTPLLLWMFADYSKRKKIFIIVFWYIILLSSLLYIVANGAEYQYSLFDRGFSNNSFIKDVFLSNLNAIWYGFIKCWWILLSTMKIKLSHLIYGFGITFIFLSITQWINQLPNEQGNFKANVGIPFWIWPLVGLVIFVAGFFPYSVTDLRYDKWRVFYYSAIGPALVFGEVLYRIGKKKKSSVKSIESLLGVGIIFIAAINGLRQHDLFVSISRKQQQILTAITEQSPIVKPETFFILLVESIEMRPFSSDRVFENALRWTYDQHRIHGGICFISLSNCRLDGNRLQYKTMGGDGSILIQNHSYNQLLFFQYTENLDTILVHELSGSNTIQGNFINNYQPYNLIIYLPFPIRPQKAFINDLGPNPNRVSPQGWIGTGQTMNDRRVCDTARQGDCSLHLQGYGKTPPSFSQEIKVNGQVGQTVKLTLRAKVEAQVVGGLPPQATITFVYEDGVTTHTHLLLGGLSKTWSAMSVKMTAAKPFTSIILKLEGGAEPWSIWIDAVQLQLDNAPLPLLNSSFEN